MTPQTIKTEKLTGLRLLLPGLLMLAGLAASAEIISIRMDKADERYQVHAETWLAAAPAFVFSVLLDYDEFHRLSGGITSTRWLDETLDNQPLAYTRLDSCVAFFCRKLEKVEVVRVSGELSFSTEALPERSDFRHYFAAWRLLPDKGGTRIVYEMSMQPDFWVPPLIGPWAIRRKAESSALKIAQRIEYLAATETPLERFTLDNYLANGQ